MGLKMQLDPPLFQPGDLLIKRWEPDAGASILITDYQSESCRTYAGDVRFHWVYRCYQGGRFHWVTEYLVKQEYRTEKSSPPIAAGG